MTRIPRPLAPKAAPGGGALRDVSTVGAGAGCGVVESTSKLETHTRSQHTERTRLWLVALNAGTRKRTKTNAATEKAAPTPPPIKIVLWSPILGTFRYTVYKKE